MLLCRLSRGLAPLLFAVSIAAMPARAQTVPPQSLQISVDSEVRSAPDLAVLSAGVMTMAATAQAAMSDNARQMSAMMAALKKAGIAEKDIQTAGINLSPQFRYRDNQAPELTGYQASNMVEVRVRALDRIGTTLDALVAQGANQINGPTFTVQNADALLDQARADAVKKGLARAEVYARAAGLKVIRLTAISEGAAAAPPMPMLRQSAMAMEASNTPVAPGQVGLTASIVMQFELGR